MEKREKDVTPVCLYYSSLFQENVSFVEMIHIVLVGLCCPVKVFCKYAWKELLLCKSGL